MNTNRFIAIAALTTLATFGAHADEFYGSQHALQFDGQRSRAEVKTEALNPVQITNGGTGVLQITPTGVTRADVRAEAAAALRAGEIPQGEMAYM